MTDRDARFKFLSKNTVHVAPPDSGNPPGGHCLLPGSKSITARALLCAALAPGESLLEGAADCDDTRSLVDGLGALGISIRREGRRLHVAGAASHPPRPHATIDVGLAGTTTRFLMPLLAATEGANVVLRGTPRMHERPVGDLIRALRSAGADIDCLEEPDRLPVRVRGRNLDGHRFDLRAAASSQSISALLLAAPLFRRGVEVTITPDRGSMSYVDLTVETLRRFGVPVERRAASFAIAPSARPRPRTISIPGDASTAAYYWAMAAVGGGVVGTHPLDQDWPQADLRLLPVLQRMGCAVSHGNGDSEVVVRGPRRLAPVRADFSQCPDAAQAAAVVAACAHGTSRLIGLESLTSKETDRISALGSELSRLGVTVQATTDALVVHGGDPMTGGRVATWGDHRMAMAFAVLGTRPAGVTIEEPGVVSKSHPGFWNDLEALGLSIE